MANNSEIAFNLNWYVKVKLTETGMRHLMDRHLEMFEFWDRYGKMMPEYLPPKFDSDGYTKYQMWHLMQIFGSKMHMGGPLPFESMEVIMCIDQ